MANSLHHNDCLTGLKKTECNEAITEFSKNLVIASNRLHNDADDLFHLIDCLFVDGVIYHPRAFKRYSVEKQKIQDLIEETCSLADDIRYLRARIEKLDAYERSIRQSCNNPIIKS